MSKPRSGLALERIVVAAVVSATVAILLVCALRGFGAAPFLAIAVSAAVGLAMTAWLATRLPVALDGAWKRSRVASALWLLLGIVTVAGTGRLATFMVDESQASASFIPWDPFFVAHSCLTSYYQGARNQREGVSNVYERTLYESVAGEPHMLGPFTVDPYQYPPPFLLLPRIGLLGSTSFTTWRRVFFALEGLIVALALGGVAFWIGGPRGRRAGLLALLVWTSLPVLLTLQIGNFQLVAIGASILARVAIDRGQRVAGGAVLGLMSVAKIFPAVLVLELLFRRQWRAVLWTSGFAIAFVAVARIVLGAAPFEAFLGYQLPRLSSGAAFETIFIHPDAVACSHAIFGVIQKLGMLGLPGMTLTLASQVASLYTVVLVGVSWLAARSGEDRWAKALAWIALVQLASLRSPFVPDVYAQFAPLWIVILLLARGGWRAWQVALLGLAVVLLEKTVPSAPIPPIPLLAAVTLVHQLIFLGLCFWVLWRAPRLGAGATLESPAL
jgi:hypothetical protein